jgi:large subunit ribosomal protein L38
LVSQETTFQLVWHFYVIFENYEKTKKKNCFSRYMDKHRDQKQISKELLLKRLKTVDPFKPKEPEYKYPNALPENNNLPSWLRVEIRKQRLKWGRYSDM